MTQAKLACSSPNRISSTQNDLIHSYIGVFKCLDSSLLQISKPDSVRLGRLLTTSISIATGEGYSQTTKHATDLVFCHPSGMWVHRFSKVP